MTASGHSSSPPALPPDSTSWTVTWRAVIVPLLTRPHIDQPDNGPRARLDREYLRGRWHEVAVAR